MATIEATSENFETLVLGNNIVFVDFWAPWCGPCRSFAPIYEAVSEQHPDVVFLKVNTEDQPELANHFQVRSIPTLMIFREQIGVFAQPGMLPASALEELLGKVRELNMDDVRKSISEHQHDENCGHNH